MKQTLRVFKNVAAWLICSTGLLAFIKCIRLRFLCKPVTTILCYHRVSDKDLLLSSVRTSLANFANHVSRLSKYYCFISLQELSPFLLTKELPKQDSLIFTFDDGYQCNLESVSAILKRHNTWGTFFVSSGPVLNNTPYWLDIIGQELQKTIGGTGAFDNEFRQIFGENELIAIGKSSYQDVWRKGKQFVQNYFNGQLDRKAGESLKKVISSTQQIDDHERQTATHEQLIQLQKEGHAIGAHTVSHPRLSNLSQAACTTEVEKSIQDLTFAGLTINSFAYPFGKLSDIGEHALSALTRCHIPIAVTTEERPVTTHDPPLLLPRLVVANQTASVLACRIELLAWKNLFGSKSIVSK